MKILFLSFCLFAGFYVSAQEYKYAVMNYDIAKQVQLDSGEYSKEEIGKFLGPNRYVKLNNINNSKIPTKFNSYIEGINYVASLGWEFYLTGLINNETVFYFRKKK